MKSRLTYSAIATFAVLGTLALGIGPASAAFTATEGPGGTQVQLAFTPERCAEIRDEIAALRQELAMWQEDLVHAPPHHKGDIMKQIKRIYEEIRALAGEADRVGCPD
jgi:hypothetical protein